ncbi:MAG: NAD(P)/FAD-dependent oxidoreductase [Candidatus Heimdallarchaeota archaeon]
MIYDLIVIGAGPGGSTAAKVAADGGANVLLLEAADEGRYKCCAGGIPVSNEVFSEIPHGIGDREITGGVLVTPQKEIMEFKATGEKNRGYCMFRTDFDKFLVDIARDAGSQVRYDFFVKAIEKSKSEVILRGPEEYRARCVIIATGLGGAKLQRQIGIEVPTSINAIQAEFAIPESSIDEEFGNRIWEFFGYTSVDHGLAWAFPKIDAVSIGILGKSLKMRDFEEFLNNPIIKNKIENRKMIEFEGRKIWAALIPDHLISKPYSDRIMVIGDACGTADPILYEGIYQARLSGKLAAIVFSGALEQDDFGEESLSQYYNLLLKLLYEEELRYTYKIHHLLFHSGLLGSIINASYAIAQDDQEMMQSLTAMFSGSQTRKHIWRVMMSKKWKLMKQLGIRNSLRLIPPFIRSSSI